MLPSKYAITKSLYSSHRGDLIGRANPEREFAVGRDFLVYKTKNPRFGVMYGQESDVF
jgi:hypothetical protein